MIHSFKQFQLMNENTQFTNKRIDVVATDIISLIQFNRNNIGNRLKSIYYSHTKNTFIVDDTDTKDIDIKTKIFDFSIVPLNLFSGYNDMEKQLSWILGILKTNFVFKK